MNISPGEKETERGKNQVKRATVKITGSYSAQPRVQRQFPVTPKKRRDFIPTTSREKTTANNRRRAGDRNAINFGSK